MKAELLLRAVLNFFWEQVVFTQPMSVAWLMWPHIKAPRPSRKFQKILNHRGIVISDPIGALAHLQLGRAYALARENTEARSAYQDFLTLWKDADPDIPIFKQAKAEYAQLQ